MKKVLLLLVGGLVIGVFANSQATANEVDVDNATISDTAAIENVDGEASDEKPQDNKKRSLTKSAGTRSVKIEKFYIEVTDGATDSIAVPMPNTNVSIFYWINNKATYVYSGRTNGLGEISNLTLSDIPNEVTSLGIRFTLGNEERGFIQKFNKIPYAFTFTKTIPEGASIKYSSKVKFGNTADPDLTFYNFQATRMNLYFNQAVQEYCDAVKLANDFFPNSKPFESAPININFEKGKCVDEGNVFNRNGYDGKGTAEITLMDKSNRNYSQVYLMHNVMHEWTHWNLYRYANASGGEYTGHFGYNLNPKISFKEGWPLMIGDLFAYNYNLNWEDKHVQTDKYEGVNRLYGKSTNYTVKQVLYDLIDTGVNDESFSLSQRYLDGEMSDLEVRRLNLGILHTVMAESKTVTLQDLLTSVEKKYVLTRSDKEKFAKLLEMNGISRDGAFTLNGNGSPLVAPLQATDSMSDVDEDWDD